MKNWLRFCMPLILGVALLAAPVSSASAQSSDTDALLVMSVESIDDLLDHLDYLLEVAGVEEFGTIARMMTAPFTEVIDKTMPIGALALVNEDDEVYPLLFLPVDDFEAALDVLELTLEDDIEEVGDDLYMIDLDGNTVFLKNEGDWVFVSNSEDALENLPKNPEDYLGDLPENYVVAIQANVQNIPEMFVEMAITQLRAGMAGAMLQEPDETDEAYELRKDLVEGQVEQIIEAIEQTDQITFGWAVDEDAGSTYLDISVTAVPGTPLAQQMESLKGTTSNFAGFLLPDAAVTFNSSSTVSEADAARAADLFEGILQQALAEIDQDADLDDDRAAAKEIVSDLFGILTDTIASGEMDGGGALVLGEESLTAVFGMHVADGSDVEDVLRRLAELAKNEPDFPGIVFDDESHAGVSFHTMEIPIPDEDARRIFGDELQVVIGTGEESVYFAFGTDPIEVLVTAIDASAESADKEVLPFQLNVAIAPIMQFAASVEDDENLVMVAGLLEDIRGRDHISIAAHPIENGITYRFEVEEGIIEAIGLGIKMFTADRGPGGPGFPGGPPPGGFDF